MVENNKIVEKVAQVSNTLRNVANNPNTFSSNVSINQHCISVDVEYKNCMFKYLTLKVNGIKMLLNNSTLENSVKVNNSKTAVIISNKMNTLNLSNYEGWIYLLGSK